jgi:hypothetical protein
MNNTYCGPRFSGDLIISTIVTRMRDSLSILGERYGRSGERCVGVVWAENFPSL